MAGQTLDDCVSILTATFGSLDAVARGLRCDPQEVADALKVATVDTAEYIALQYLSKYNPQDTNGDNSKQQRLTFVPSKSE